MLYNLLTNYSETYTFLNFFNFLTVRTGLAIITAMIVVFLIGDKFINYFSTKKIRLLNPIIQNNLIPVFVDTELGFYNPSVESIENAVGPKTKGIFIAHTLGNPYDAEQVSELAKSKQLWFIEDNASSTLKLHLGCFDFAFFDLNLSLILL